MPVQEFVKELLLPPACSAADPAARYRFTVRVSWDELSQDGTRVAANFVYEMLSETDDAAGDAEFTAAGGLFELQPTGQSAFRVDARNVWDQQLHAIDPSRHSPTSPGGCDVQYRDRNNQTVADKTSGEPFRIAHAGPLDSIELNLEQQCVVTCRSNPQVVATGTLRVTTSFPTSAEMPLGLAVGPVHAAGHPAHVHAQTFTDVIQEGFSTEEFGALRATDDSRLSGVLPAPGPPLRMRQDAATLPQELQSAFRNAVQRLVNDGTYLRLVRQHMNMSHNMHGSRQRTVGLLRFLAWHRRYLQEFETELQRADLIERPTAPVPITVPYWRWSTPFPAWLRGFLPALDPLNGNDVPPRRLTPASLKPTGRDVLSVLNDFAAQLPGEPVNDYVRFTYGLEGFARRRDGSEIRAHNHAHSWVGGIMNNRQTSPTDPFFWLHHAEVDRLWHIWQLSHGGLHPPLTGRNRILDPWPESYDDVVDITLLGYHYASVLP